MQRVKLVDLESRGGWDPCCATCVHSAVNDGVFRDAGYSLRCTRAAGPISDADAENNPGLLAGDRELLVKPTSFCSEWHGNDVHHPVPQVQVGSESTLGIAGKPMYVRMSAGGEQVRPCSGCRWSQPHEAGADAPDGTLRCTFAERTVGRRLAVPPDATCAEWEARGA